MRCPGAWVGSSLRQQAQLREAAEADAAQAAAAGEAYALLAESALRDRIAADLHDYVGHDLALIVLQAGRLEALGDEDVRREAARLRAVASDATDRRRAYVGSVDRPDPAGSVAEVVGRARRSGMDVVLTGDGDHPVLIRAAVEGLTNALRHAPGSVVEVEADRRGIVVSNDLPDPTTVPAHGLGLRRPPRHGAGRRGVIPRRSRGRAVCSRRPAGGATVIRVLVADDEPLARA